MVVAQSCQAALADNSKPNWHWHHILIDDRGGNLGRGGRACVRYGGDPIGRGDGGGAVLPSGCVPGPATLSPGAPPPSWGSCAVLLGNKGREEGRRA